MMKVKTNFPVEKLSREQKVQFNKWLSGNRTFINLILPDGRVFTARKEK